ncbi:MAG: dipeptidase [Oscillospiraceae bacterium]
MEKDNGVCRLPRLPMVDAHYDLGMYVRQERQKGRRRVIETDLLEGMRQGGVQVLMSAIYVDEQSVNGTALQQACEQLAALQAELRESPGLFAVCTSYAELQRAAAEGKLAILLSFEGAEPLGQNVELLDFFYGVGVRALGLAHSRRNQACDGARYTSGPHNLGCGLTDLGVAFIERAQELHMLIDVSHLNDAGAEDVLSLTTGPVIASHSDCRALNPTLRNLSDTLIRRIADRGGVIGLNGCSAIVGDRAEDATAERLADHLDHLVQVAGVEHVGFGLDIAEMILPEAYITVNGFDQRVKDMVPGHRAVPQFLELLSRRGYTEEALCKICAGNFLRVFREVLG